MSSIFTSHPGLTLRDDILLALNLQVGEAAAHLGVDRTTLSKVLNGRAAISLAMALRIERWLGRDHGGAAEVWLAQQAAYDLWRARAALKASEVLSGVKALKLQSASKWRKTQQMQQPEPPRGGSGTQMDMEGWGYRGKPGRPQTIAATAHQDQHLRFRKTTLAALAPPFLKDAGTAQA